MANFELNINGRTFQALELTVPGTDTRTDILAIMLFTEHRQDDFLKVDMEMLDYQYGASLMTDDEICKFMTETVLEYLKKEAEKKPKWADKIRKAYAENTGGGYVVAWEYFNEHQYIVLSVDTEDIAIFDDTDEEDFCLSKPIMSWSLADFELLTVEQKSIVRELWASARPLAKQEYEFEEIVKLDNIICK